MYNFRIKYAKGKGNCAATALSRFPTLASKPEESVEIEDEAACAATIAATVEAGGR